MKPTILAVDDDPIMLDMYQAVLEETYLLKLVSSGEEALGFLHANPRIDLVLLDIVMPGMDGYEVCRRIRSDAAFAHLKIILVSSKVKLEERLWGYQAGADDYVTKPFEASELTAKLKVFLRLKTAEEIDRIKTNFINHLNHESRTPLTAICGYVTLLQQSPNLSEQERNFVEKIERWAATLLRSSENTLLLSDLKSGNIHFQTGPIALTSFLHDCQHKFAAAAQEKELQFNTRSEDDLTIYGDPKLLGIAVDALLDNAVKFALEETTIHVNARAVDDRIEVEVANEGEKISGERCEQIFDECGSLDIDHHHQGSGLSLPIARRIVEAHDGRLLVDNVADGPVFTMTFSRIAAGRESGTQEDLESGRLGDSETGKVGDKETGRLGDRETGRS